MRSCSKRATLVRRRRARARAARAARAPRCACCAAAQRRWRRPWRFPGFQNSSATSWRSVGLVGSGSAHGAGLGSRGQRFTAPLCCPPPRHRIPHRSHATHTALTFFALQVHGLKEACAAVRAAGRRLVVATPRILKPDEQRLWLFYLRLGADALLLRSAGLLQQLNALGGPGACAVLCCDGRRAVRRRRWLAREGQAEVGSHTFAPCASHHPRRTSACLLIPKQARRWQGASTRSPRWRATSA